MHFLFSVNIAVPTQCAVTRTANVRGGGGGKTLLIIEFNLILPMLEKQIIL